MNWIGAVTGLLFLFNAMVANAQEPLLSELKIGSTVLKVEVALTEPQLQKGLMFRKDLGADRGMLFVFSQQKTLNFWMKNTFINLDIGFFDKDRSLVDVQSMDAVKSEMQTAIPQVASRKPAMYALEVNRGWFSSHKIKLGQKFQLSEAKP